MPAGLARALGCVLIADEFYSHYLYAKPDFNDEAKRGILLFSVPGESSRPFKRWDEIF